MSASLTPVSRMESSKDYAALAKRFYELLDAHAPDFIDADPSTPFDDLPNGYKLLLAQVFITMIGEGSIR